MNINIDQFSAVKLLVGRIDSAEIVESSKKMLKLSIDVGEESPRTILSGIRKNYSPEEISGKMCVVVANLEPREFLGFESNGMLVCVSYVDVDGEECAKIVEPPEGAPIGSRLS